jgi:hypothetical protein
LAYTNHIQASGPYSIAHLSMVIASETPVVQRSRFFGTLMLSQRPVHQAKKEIEQANNHKSAPPY